MASVLRHETTRKIDQWVNFLPHKLKDLSSDPYYLYNNPNILVHDSNLSVWRDRDRKSLVVCGPASSAGL